MDVSFPIVELEYFLLVFVRVTCFIFVAPFFSMNNTPNMVKIGFGFFFSYLLYYVTMPHVYPEYATLSGYAVLVLKEATVGLLIGLSAAMCMSIVIFAGRLVDTEMGFAMVNQFDPTTREDATISGLYYQYAMMLLLIVSGMYRYLISALTETFQLIPVGEVRFNLDSLYGTWVSFLGQYFVLGMRICLPVFCTIMILNAILGILAKVSPQMNMFSVGMQLKVITGLVVLFITVSMLPYASDLVFTQMKRMVVSFVEGMM